LRRPLPSADGCRSLHLVSPDQTDHEHTGEDHDDQQDDDPRDRPHEEEGREDGQDCDDRAQGDRDSDQV
jgi:hypothetical protein